MIPFSRRDTVIIPSRSRTTISIRVENLSLAEGYIPRIDLCDDVYPEDTLVTNRDRRAFIDIINTDEANREIEISVIELKEVKFISPHNPDLVRKTCLTNALLISARNYDGMNIKTNQL